MKEIPILFSTPMVQAILAGRKTQTRRIIKPQPTIDQESGYVFDGKHKKQYDIHSWKDQFLEDWSRWMPEDQIWVRESWSPVSPKCGEYYYKASDPAADSHKWKPSIHMPKVAARIWKEVISVKIERLHDINQDEAKAEGFACITKDGGRAYKYGIPDADGLPGVDNIGWPWQDWETNPVKAFEKLWYRINGEESWIANPWVWVIEFKVLSTNGKPAQLSEKIMATNS